jgi:LCP family protein required for cell wall assembly
LIAAGLSALLPGLGQVANRDLRSGAIFAAPALGLLAAVWLLFQLRSPAALAATLITQPFLTIVLVLNAALMLWRLAAVGHAFLDPRFAARPTGRGWIGLALLMAFVALPHGLANWVGTAASSSFDRVFQSGSAGATSPPGPGTTERLNVLLIGLDAGPGRTAELTDTLIVVSLDPVGETVTMISIPRDTVNVPLGGGDVYEPKINSLLGYAQRHPETFGKDAGFATLKTAIGELLGIEVHYHVQADLAGFVAVVDAVGGVDVDVKRALDDPKYGFPDGRRGWSIGVGRHHLNGEDALAYARIRRTTGESDFTRAERQQQVLVAIRNAATRGDSLLLRLPALLDAVGNAIRTDMPRDRLPALAAIAGEIDGGRVTRIVIRHPLVAPASNRYGSVQVPDIPAIRAVAAQALGEPGVPPVPWPTPKPTASPRASAP